MAAAQIVTKLKCSAERFKWLWAIQGALEKIMLRECKHVAETFVAYCSRLVHEGAAVVGHRAWFTLLLEIALCSSALGAGMASVMVQGRCIPAAWSMAGPSCPLPTRACRAGVRGPA